MILVADDTELHREATAALLRTRGYAVRTCADGVEAVAQLHRQLPRVLVLDLLMCPVNGMDVLEELARNPRRKDVSVIVTTALPEPLPPLPVNATVLRKPFGLDTLVAEIERQAPLERG